MKQRCFFSLIVLAIAGSTSLLADAIPYGNPGTIAPENQFQAAANGDISAYFYGSSALFTERLGLFVNGTQRGGWVLDDHTSTYGEMVDFGPVQAGDNLVFALQVEDTNYTVFSESSLNPDQINHTYATPFSGGNQGNRTIPAGTFVGFEDALLSFSDLNYNDEDFVFTNTRLAASAPEPGTCILWLGGALFLAAGMLRKAV